MIALFCLSLVALLRPNHARESLSDIAARYFDDTCDPKGVNCLEDQGNNQGGLVNTITLTAGPTGGDGEPCCYTYTSVATDTVDCRAVSPAQSHWTLMPVCDANDTLSVTIDGIGASVGVDASTCYSGIKIDQGCSATCTYVICIEYESTDQCCTRESVFSVKAGTQHSFGYIDAPSCNCETPPPTDDPTESPTPNPSENPTVSPSDNPTVTPSNNPTTSPTNDPSESPTRSPTENPSVSPTRNPTVAPSSDPSVSPTSDPTLSPSDNPTVSPTRNPSVTPTSDPTPSPTSYCTPIVQVNVNKKCTEFVLDREDTNVLWTKINQYEDGTVFGDLYNEPQDALSQIVLDHSCDQDNKLFKAMAEPMRNIPEEVQPQPKYPAEVQTPPKYPAEVQPQPKYPAEVQTPPKYPEVKPYNQYPDVQPHYEYPEEVHPHHEQYPEDFRPRSPKSVVPIPDTVVPIAMSGQLMGIMVLVLYSVVITVLYCKKRGNVYTKVKGYDNHMDEQRLML